MFNVVKVGKGLVNFFIPPTQQIGGTLSMNQTGDFYITFNVIYVENYSVTVEQNIHSNPDFSNSENWVEVKRFNDEIWFMPGYTAPFMIDCKEWRIRWEVVSIFYLGDLNFWVVPQGNYHGTSFDDSLGIAGINRPVTTDGVLNITSNPGTYYLFTGTSGSKYTLIVEKNMDSLQESDSNWVEVTRFNGTIWGGNTEPFTIDHVDWRIKWSYEPTVDASVFALRFHFNVVEVGGKLVKFFIPPSKIFFY